MKYTSEQLLFFAFWSGLSAQVTLADSAPAAGVWTLEVFLDMLVLGGLGLIGGALSLIFMPVPVRKPRDIALRLGVSGTCSSLAAGGLLLLVPLDPRQPGLRILAAGLTGFFAHSILWYLSQNWRPLLVGWLGSLASWISRIEPPPPPPPPPPAPPPPAPAPPPAKVNP